MHVVLEPGSHVTLFVPAQKNDKLSQKLFVTLAWISGSGVSIGAWIQRLLSRLRECDLQRPTLPCLCFCQQWATWDTAWFLQECPCRSHRYYAKSCPASSPFLAQSQPCWLRLAFLSQRRCYSRLWQWSAYAFTGAPRGLVERARTEGLHHGRLRSAAICHLMNVMPCITNFFILRMPVCSKPKKLV